MKVKEIISQHRRDFRAIYVCEHCGAEIEKGGYDDANFHQNVIPKMKCATCGRISDENYCPLTTKYPDDMVI